MRLSVVTDKGQGLGLASHLSSEGHSVSFNVTTLGNMGLGEGVVRLGADENPDIYIYMDDLFGELADSHRKNGTRTLGASTWSQTIESNKEYSANLIQAIGWPTRGVNNGINLYVTAWFNGNDFISNYSGLVYRRFMSGGRGPDVNFTGVLANFKSTTPRVRNDILEPLKKVLRRANHRGCFHVHLLVDGENYAVQEISASFNHPLVYLLFENSKLTTSEVLLKVFDESSQRIQSMEQWVAGVLISVPPYPYTVHSEPVRLKGIVPANLKHLWLVDTKKVDGEWFTSGTNGNIGYVTARGGSVSEATRRVYRTIGNLEVRDLQYRDDVGKNTRNLLASLKQSGWIN